MYLCTGGLTRAVVAGCGGVSQSSCQSCIIRTCRPWVASVPAPPAYGAARRRLFTTTWWQLPHRRSPTLAEPVGWWCVAKNWEMWFVFHYFFFRWIFHLTLFTNVCVRLEMVSVQKPRVWPTNTYRRNYFWLGRNLLDQAENHSQQLYSCKKKIFSERLNKAQFYRTKGLTSNSLQFVVLWWDGERRSTVETDSAQFKHSQCEVSLTYIYIY